MPRNENVGDHIRFLFLRDGLKTKVVVSCDLSTISMPAHQKIVPECNRLGVDALDFYPA